MPRRVAALLLVVVLVAIAGAAAPDEAHALSPGGTGSPWNSLSTGGSSSGYVGRLVNLLRGQSTTQGLQYGTLIGGESNTTKAGIKTMMFRGRVAGRFLPTLATVGTRLTLIGTAGYIGWRVYQHFADGSTQTLDMWLDSNTLGADALANPAASPSSPAQYYAGGSTAWKWWPANVEWVKIGDATACGAIGAGVTTCWSLWIKPTYCWDGVTNPLAASCSNTGRAWVSSQSGLGGTVNTMQYLDHDQCLTAYPTCGYGSGGTRSSWVGAWLEWRTIENLEGREYGANTVTTRTGTTTVGAYAIDWKQILLPEEALGPSLGVLHQDGDTLTSPHETTDPYNVPTTATSPTTQTIVDVLTPFDSPCGRALINHILEPTVYPWVPGCIETAPTAEPDPATVTLPRPMANETYPDYILRLQDRGWLGSATLVELDPYDPEIGPEAVSKLGVTGKPGTWRRALWPSTNPTIGYSVDLTIWHNPDTAPPVNPDPTDEDTPEGGGGVVDPGGTCDGPLEADPDFGPLLGLDFGDRFPFGLFTWVASVLGAFLVTPDAPNWTFDITIPATSVTPAYDFEPFTIDLEWLDDYMATFRLLLTFVLWVGAIWYVGSGLLGLRTGGNPAEAVDDVL